MAEHIGAEVQPNAPASTGGRGGNAGDTGDAPRPGQIGTGDATDDVAVAAGVAALPLGGAPLVGAAMGSASGFSPAAAGTAPLAGSAIPLVAPILATNAAAASAGNGDVAQRIETALVEDGRLGLNQHITVAVTGCVVELGGTVASDHDRQVAEAICARQPGVAAVRNQITVR